MKCWYLIRNNTSFEDFYFIDSIPDSSEYIKYILLIISLIIVQSIILYEALISFHEILCLGHQNKDAEIKIIIKKYNLNYITESYLFKNYSFYLCTLYFLEAILFIFFFFFNLSYKLISFYFILIVLFLAIFARLLGAYLDRFVDWRLAKRLRLEMLEELQEVLKIQTDRLREYHVINYGRVFEDIIKREVEKKKQARLNEIDRSLFEANFEDLDTELSPYLYDRLFYPGRIQNFIIVFYLFILNIIAREDFSIFKMIFLG